MTVLSKADFCIANLSPDSDAIIDVFLSNLDDELLSESLFFWLLETLGIIKEQKSHISVSIEAILIRAYLKLEILHIRRHCIRQIIR
jgi:hypothetical protein